MDIVRRKLILITFRLKWLIDNNSSSDSKVKQFVLENNMISDRKH